MWEWMGYLCAAALLAYHSVFDIKKQYIPGRSLVVGVALSCCWALARGFGGAALWAELGAALLPGAVTLALAQITREQIGRGDGWELILMGNWIGLKDCLLALGVALLGVFGQRGFTHAGKGRKAYSRGVCALLVGGHGGRAAAPLDMKLCGGVCEKTKEYERLFLCGGGVGAASRAGCISFSNCHTFYTV